MRPLERQLAEEKQSSRSEDSGGAKGVRFSRTDGYSQQGFANNGGSCLHGRASRAPRAIFANLRCGLRDYVTVARVGQTGSFLPRDLQESLATRACWAGPYDGSPSEAAGEARKEICGMGNAAACVRMGTSHASELM